MRNNNLNSLKNIRLTKNPFLLFLPFLLFYIIFIMVFYSSTLWGDEMRHLAYAENLYHGFYSPPAPNISFEVGPGYPLFILFFILLHIPFVVLVLMNAVLTYLAIVFLFKALLQIVPFGTALVFSLFLACYSNSLEFIALIYSESLTLFLVSLLLFVLIKSFNRANAVKTKKYIYLAGFTIGFLALTKIIFGYVLLFMLSVSALFWLINRKSPNYRKSVYILLVALVTTAPYLIYTYHMSGKLFYWGTSGGNNLYWMSTPYEGEYGNWVASPQFKNDTLVLTGASHTTHKGAQLNIKNRTNYIPGGADSLDLHHQKDFMEINKYGRVERDEIYKKMAMNNIRSHPAKYIENCISNIGRILFNYPYSYTFQKPGTLLRLPLNGIILVCMIFCLIPTLINWRKLFFPVRFILIFCMIYLGGSVFGSAETRMFTVIVPILLLWIAYIAQKSLKIKWKYDRDAGDTNTIL